MTLESVVVVGASLAGVRAAETLRREGFGGRLTLIGAESHWPPYDRPPLSKQVLEGKWDAERARLRVDLEPSGVDLVLGRRAVELDLSTRHVLLDDGALVPFDGLVIASGTEPRTLPGLEPDGERVHVLRTYEDSVALRAALDRSTSGVAVIGAGFIGCEVASAARVLGHRVTVVETLPFPLGRVVGDDVGAMAAALHRANGVDLRLGVDARDALATATAASDVVVVGVGVTPSVGWLAGSSVTVDNGVVCDASMAAAGTDGVVACGDIARWPHPLFDGDLVRLEHWTNATESAEHAARTLLGGREPFAEVPYFWSDQHGTKFQMVGANRAGDAAAVVEGSLTDVGDDGKVRAVVAYLRGAEQRVVAALCINQANRTIAWRSKVAERATLS